MSGEYVFLFDLDGTVTLEETLPIIANHFNLKEEIEKLTDSSIKGNIPFMEGFIRRVEYLKKIPVSKINDLLESVSLSQHLVDFMRFNNSSSFIVTGNLRNWVTKLVDRIGVQCFASEGMVEDDRLVKLLSIIKKEEIVKIFQQQGKRVVFIGDGHNDCEAMRIADISIACGIVHYPANSVLSIADYAVFSEQSIVSLLNSIIKPSVGKTLVLSCAGIGSRLGIGQTKALIEVNGEKLISIQLRAFQGISDLRIVIGFQSNDVISEVLKIRKDVVFVYNHDYFHTKTGYSLYLGSRFAKEYVLAWDGDLLVHPNSILECLDFKGEFIGCSEIMSAEPVFVRVDNCSNQVIEFSRDSGDLEWSGPACIKSKNIKKLIGNVFDQISPYLPIHCLKIKAMDIDTSEDYENAIIFVKSWEHTIG